MCAVRGEIIFGTLYLFLNPVFQQSILYACSLLWKYSEELATCLVSSLTRETLGNANNI